VSEPVCSHELVQMRCEPDEVHVWRVELECARRSAVALVDCLSPAERERAARFRWRDLRDRWSVAHGALRYILAEYARANPASLSFEVGPNGKPELCWPVSGISFSLSHTGGLALLGVASGKRVGIDAEILQSGIEVGKLSRRFFAAAETEQILALPPKLQLAAFFACWTRKEAIAKALGDGLSKPLDRFEVTVRSDEPARLVSIEGDSRGRWTLFDISERGIAAALATEGCTRVLRRLEFEPPLA
jgi:4'-phosphopantetheinyl transferase